MPKGPNMGTDSNGTSSSGDNRIKHNPDADNLKSLLKKTSKKERSKHQNRVVFNETKNEFFDADYIILIREECCSGAGDYDDDDDDDEDGGVCTCYQHEMVRLQTTPCCEPDCECYMEENTERTHRDQQRSPKFAPPMEFVDSVVTLSPPEGYKDLELDEHALAEYRQQQKLAARNKALLQQQQQQQQQNMGRQAVCRECSASGDLEGDRDDRSQSNYEAIKSAQESREESNNNEKIDQSQQTTPTSPNNTDGQNYTLDSIEDEKSDPLRALPNMGSPVSGILKGGRLWRQQSSEDGTKSNEFSKTDSASDEDGPNHRTVRFVEAEEKKDKCKASPELEREIEGGEVNHKNIEDGQDKESDVASEPTEMMLTFKLGNHMLISNNSLKPNSAVRQLFPSAKPLADGTAQDDASDQYLVTAESLKAFEEAKRAKLPQIIHNDSIKRVIERNTLRRSLVRYEPRRKQTQKTDNSLVERIKQLTCDIDTEVGQQESEELLARVSPTGEEQRTATVDGNNQANKYKEPTRNFSPTSSSTTSSNSSMSSTYKKITDLFGKKDKPDSSSPVCLEPKTVQTQTLPDIGGPYINHQDCNEKIIRPNPTTESRKQFLSTLAPLTACVSNVSQPDGEYHYHLSTNNRHNHHQYLESVTSSTESEYTLEDIDEGLNNEGDAKKNVSTPDVLAGTPASESGDELVNFVQQDQNRIDRIKKKYENDQKKPSSTNEDEDDENDDYGFNHRPSVRGIKPRFGSTTEILQQIQNQIQMPATNANTTAWYYSDEDANRVKHNQQQYNNVTRQQYRPTSLHENYQNCASQTCYKEVYKTQSYIEMDCNDYQRVPKQLRNGRALSPPPQDISKNYHQTMVYIPYNHIEGYHPVAYQTNEYYRYNQNQINKKYIDTIYHHKMTTHLEEQYCNSNLPHIQKMAITTKGQYPANYQHLAPSSRSESPLFGGTYSTARATQTAVGCIPSCNVYSVPPPTIRYRDGVRPQWKPEYATVEQIAANKAINRHSFPIVRPKYPSDNPQDPMCLEDGQQQHNTHSFNGYYNYGMQNSPADSPTKARYIERGVPEGAASVSPQDSIVTASSSSVATSPTVPHPGNIAGNPKPLFYAMNV